MVFK
jgi:hypothetical protein